ncbi:MAG: helix-turn-helix transcriptional regulator [Chloroflexota bacterium]|nr:helix-turn-helix transcriptional regulator [Chloroflexota bacterium]
MRDLDKSFGDAIRQRRKELGLSQEALSFKAGLHRNYISDIERGLKSPSLRVIVKLADALGLAVSTMMRMAEENASRPMHSVKTE